MEAGAADIETGEAFDMFVLPCSVNSDRRMTFEVSLKQARSRLW